MTLAGRISAPIWAVTRVIFGHEVPHWGVGAYSRESPPPDPVERIVERKEGLLAGKNHEKYLNAVRPALPPYRPHPAAIQVVMDRPGVISLLAPNGVRVSVPENIRTQVALLDWFYSAIVPRIAQGHHAPQVDLWSRLDRTHAIACRDDTQMF